MTYRKYIFTLIYLYLCAVFHMISADQDIGLRNSSSKNVAYSAGNTLRNSPYLPTPIWGNTTMRSTITLKPEKIENVAKPVANKDSIIDDHSINKFGGATNNTSSQNNITKTIYGAHKYYNSSFTVNEAASRRLWINLDDHPNTSVIHLLSDSVKKTARTVKLSFDFPFYGHPIKNVTITTDGFLFTGELVHSWLSASQYIAPLMADFDTRFSNNSYVKYADNGTFFTVEWERVVLKPKPEAGEFTFQVTIHRNGDIVFVYAAVAVDRIREIDSYPKVKIGLSDAYIIEKTGSPVRRKTIYEYHSLDFAHQDIKNSTVIYLRTLPTCNEMDNCKDCLNRSTGFNCTWCPNLNRCSNSGLDRSRQDWLLNKCEVHNIKEGGSCPAIIANTAASYDDHDTQAVHDPEGAVGGGSVHHNDTVVANTTRQPTTTLQSAIKKIENCTKPAANEDSVRDDNGVNKVVDVTNSTSSQNNITKTIYGAHKFYNSSFSVDEATYRSYWINMDDHPNTSVIHVPIDNVRRIDKVVKMSFDFPYYGYPIKNVTITTDGFLFTGENPVDNRLPLPASLYIAPWIANFDTRFSNNSRVKYFDNGTALTVEWENVVLKEKPEAGEFTFQVTIHRNGDIVFVYAVVDVEQMREIPSYPTVKVGITDAYIVDRTIDVPLRTLYEYHRLDFTYLDIKNWTVIYLHALPTCHQMDNCEDCLNRSTEFDCMWCPYLNRCSNNGLERYPLDWWAHNCQVRKIKVGGICPAIMANIQNYDERDTQAAVYDDEDALRSNHPSLPVRIVIYTD